MKQIHVLILSIGLSIFVFSSCSNKEGQKADENKAGTETTTNKEMVRVTQLGMEQITRQIVYSSTLEPMKEVHLAPASPGRIDAINVEVGERVKKGEILVEMNDAQLIQSQIQMNNLKMDYSRLDTLKKYGSIAQQQYDQVEAQYKTARENVDFLKDNTSLLAPFNGIISGKYFENEEMYSGSPIASVGKAAILSIIQIDTLKAVVSISESYYPQIKLGMEANLKFDVYPKQNFTGKIFRIYPVIDPQSRSFEVEISIVNRDNLLRPGMFGRVTIGLKKVDAVMLPAMAILKMQGSNVRYLFIEKNGVAKRIEVQLGDRYNDKVEVISDKLQVGDHIITSGQARLLDGMKVQVVQ